MTEPENETQIRHKIADVEEKIRQKQLELNKLHSEKTSLEDALFISKYNRGVRA